MMMNKSVLSKNILGAALLLLGSAVPAHAVDYIISVGHDAGDGVITVQTGDRFLVDLGASRSYSCDAIVSDAASNFDWSPLVNGTTGSTPEQITAKLSGSTVPQTGGESGGNADNRLTFTPTTTDRFALVVASVKTGGEAVKVRCLATTLFGGYNTNVNDFNFLELTNIGNATITGRITAINFDGTTVINNQAFSVDAQQRVDVDLHTSAGADKFGIVRVTHDAPLGTLQAVVSQYSGTVSSFALTTSAPLVPFDQRP